MSDIPKLIQGLRSKNLGEAARAADGIRVIVENASARESLLARGDSENCLAYLGALAESRDVDCRIAAVGALAELAASANGRKRLAARRDWEEVLSSVAGLLSSPAEGAALYGSRYLGRLCLHPEWKKRISQHWATENLIARMVTLLSSPVASAAASVARALGEFVSTPTGERDQDLAVLVLAIPASGLLDGLALLLTHDDDQCSTSALFAVGRLASSDIGRQFILYHGELDGLLTRLSVLLTGSSSDLAQGALESLRILTSHPDGQSRLRNSPALEKMLEGLKVLSESSDVGTATTAHSVTCTLRPMLSEPRNVDPDSGQKLLENLVRERDAAVRKEKSLTVDHEIQLREELLRQKQTSYAVEGKARDLDEFARSLEVERERVHNSNREYISECERLKKIIERKDSIEKELKKELGTKDGFIQSLRQERDEALTHLASSKDDLIAVKSSMKKQHEQFTAAAEQMRRERDSALFAIRDTEQNLSTSFKDREKNLIEKDVSLQRALEKCERELAEARREVTGERGMRMQVEETCRRQIAETHKAKSDAEISARQLVESMSERFSADAKHAMNLVEQRDGEIAALRKEISNLQTANRDLHAKGTTALQMDQRAGEMQKEISNLRLANTQLQSDLKSLHATSHDHLGRLQKERDGAVQAAKNIQINLQKAQKSENEARRALSEMSVEIQQLRHKPAAPPPAPHVPHGAAEEIERLRRELESARHAHRSLTDDMHAQASSFEEAMGRLQRERDAAVAGVGSQIARGGKEEGYSGMQAELSQIQSELHAVQIDMDRQVHSLKLSLQSTARERDDALAEIDRLKSSVSDLNLKVREMSGVASILQNSSSAQQESFGITAEKLQREVEIMTVTIGERNNQIEMLEREMHKVASALKVCQVDMRSQQSSFEENVRRLQEERDEAVRASNAIHSSMVSVDILKQRDAQVVELRRELNALRQAYGDTEHGAAVQQKSLQQILDQVSRERDEGRVREDELEAKCREMAWALQQQTEASSRSHADLNAIHQRSANEVVKLKRDVENAQRESEEAGRLVTQLQSEITNISSAKRQVEAEMREVRGEYERTRAALEAERDAVMADLAATRADNISASVNATRESGLVEQLQQQLLATRNAESALEGRYQSQKKMFEDQLLKLQWERDTAVQNEAAARTQISSSQNEMRGEVASAISRAEESEARKRQAQMEIQQLTSRVEQLTLDLQSEQSRSAQFQNQLSAAASTAAEISTLRGQLDKVGRQADLQQAQSQELNRRLAEAVRERDSALDREAQIKAAAERAMDPVLSDKAQYERTIADLQRQMSTMRAQGMGLQGGDGAHAALMSMQRERDNALQQLKAQKDLTTAAEIALQQIRAVAPSSSAEGETSEVARLKEQLNMAETHARLQSEHVKLLSNKLQEAQDTLRLVAQSKGGGANRKQIDQVNEQLAEATRIARRASQRDFPDQGFVWSQSAPEPPQQYQQQQFQQPPQQYQQQQQQQQNPPQNQHPHAPQLQGAQYLNYQKSRRGGGGNAMG